MSVLIRPYKKTDQSAVIALWQNVFPAAPQHNDPLQDIQRKLTVQPDCFLIAASNGRLIGTVMAGFDGHRGWVYYLAVDPDERRQGIGKALMYAAEQALGKLGCGKVNLQVRADNDAVVAFYQSLGYSVEERISMGKRLDGQI